MDKVIQIKIPGGATIYYTPEAYKKYLEVCKVFEEQERLAWYGEYKPNLNETHKNTKLE